MTQPGKSVTISGAPTVKRWPFVVGGILLLSILGNCANIGKSKTGTGLSADDALQLCEKAIRSAVRDPDKAVIPSVPNFGDINEYHFAWNPNTRVLRLRNGLGLDVASTGSCIVQKVARHVSSVTIDGKRVR